MKRFTEEPPSFKLTPEVHKRVLKLVLAGVPIKLVYGMIGCRAATIQTWMADGQRELDRRMSGKEPEKGVLNIQGLDKYVQFYYEISAAVDTLTAKISTVPVKAALKGGDWHAARWLLERRAPDIFHEKKQDKPDGDHDGVPEVQIYMPDNGRGPK